MADILNLERMCRELKCPICLSLLDSASSLTCNHVFCLSCILKSMKSMSCCPVCKVPFQRREIRPASHMDNLVSVFKSMEASHGINVSMTPDLWIELQEEEDRRSNAATKFPDANPNTVSLRTSEVSFPTKKRVQLPKNPLSISNDVDESCPVNERRELALSPFFWLRESNDATTEGDAGTMPTVPDSPFSDVRDSDDPVPDQREDIFNWTQRSCSPELCSMPVKSKSGRKPKVTESHRRRFGRRCTTAGTGSKREEASNIEKKEEETRKRKHTVNPICVFCHSSSDSEVAGEMMHYSKGIPVSADTAQESHLIHAHSLCTEWAPDVYFDGETAVNLGEEVMRSRKIKCGVCGTRGASLGCFERGCRRSFHYPCIKLVPQSRWDTRNFVMLCPLHSSSKLPIEIPDFNPPAHAQKQKRREKSAMEEAFRVEKMVICFSGLRSRAEKEMAMDFERRTGVGVDKEWSTKITHVVAVADEGGACRRTLKFLKGILEGKWIVSTDWMVACIQAERPVKEGPYEITGDSHGVKGGPFLGRTRAAQNGRKFFHGLSFYVTDNARRQHLQELIVAGAGTVLRRKPICQSTPYVVWPGEHRRDDQASEEGSSSAKAQALAVSPASHLITTDCLLDSIARFTIRGLVHHRT